MIEMQDEFVITDLETARLLSNETRRQILFLCSREPLSISQLAKKLNKNPGLIFYHLQSLLERKLLMLHSTKPVRSIIEKKYTAVARRFRLHIDMGDVTPQEVLAVKFQLVESALRQLQRATSDERMRDRPHREHSLFVRLNTQAQQKVLRMFDAILKFCQQHKAKPSDPMFGIVMGFGPGNEEAQDEVAG